MISLVRCAGPTGQPGPRLASRAVPACARPLPTNARPSTRPRPPPLDDGETKPILPSCPSATSGGVPRALLSPDPQRRRPPTRGATGLGRPRRRVHAVGVVLSLARARSSDDRRPRLETTAPATPQEPESSSDGCSGWRDAGISRRRGWWGGGRRRRGGGDERQLVVVSAEGGGSSVDLVRVSGSRVSSPIFVLLFLRADAWWDALTTDVTCLACDLLSTRRRGSRSSCGSSMQRKYSGFVHSSLAGVVG